jgi:hypothetical protein
VALASHQSLPSFRKKKKVHCFTRELGKAKINLVGVHLASFCGALVKGIDGNNNKRQDAYMGVGHFTRGAGGKILDPIFDTQFFQNKTENRFSLYPALSNPYQV